MSLNEINPDEIEGMNEIVEWFGYWPSFHDAEVISIELHRTGSSSIEVHTYETNGELDATGHYANFKELAVRFLIEGISVLDLHNFNHQNVVFGIDIRKAESGYELTLDECFGVVGRIVADKIKITSKPGHMQTR